MGSINYPCNEGTAITITINNPIIETARWQQIVGINNISSEMPSEWKLHQNYPNPFNPVTNISIDILKSENVKLIVYDALGRETETLINDILSPGKYKVTFNASKYSSGIYFYRIISDSFKDIKKMLLIK